MKKILFQEGTADLMETIIDPMILVLYIIAAIIFGISAYKKAEIRTFIAVILVMMGATIWCLIGVEIIEATFVVSAGALSLVAAIILRLKTQKAEVAKSG